MSDKINYVLIDFENVQPKNLNALEKHPFQVLVFVGANQTKVPFYLAESMQRLGPKAKYIQISGNGKNALDFHIAYYVGILSEREPKAYFHIISRDTGFDTLIAHMTAKGLRVQRHRDIEEIPVLRITSARSSNEKIHAIVNNLAGRGQSRPRKIRTLSNTIKSLFSEDLTEKELNQLIEELRAKKFIKVTDGNVSYQLPNPH